MKRVVKWIVIGSMVWGLLLASVLFVSASDEAVANGAASQAAADSSADLHLESWPDPGQEDDTESGVVLDSGNPDDFLVEDKPITSQEVAAAILQIRSSVVFFVFGVIPLAAAVVFLYLFFRWIYRLIISVI